MDDQNQPSDSGSNTPPETLPPPVQSFPQPYSQAPQPVSPQIVTPVQPLMQWEQRVSGPVGGSVVGPATLPEPGLPVMFAQQPPRKKKGLMIGIVSVITLLILGAGGVFAYTVWNQTPDKVLSDAMLNFLQAKTVTYKGTFAYESKSAAGSKSTEPIKYTLTTDGKGTLTDSEVNVTLTIKMADEDVSLDGSGVFDKDGNIYVKIDKLTELLSLKVVDKKVADGLKPLLTSLEDKWVKIANTDIEDLAGSDYKKTQACTRETWKKFAADKTSMLDVVDVYKNNKFFVVDSKVGIENGSVGYRIKMDKDKLKTFIDGVNNTKIIKELQKCDKDTYTFKSDNILKSSPSDAIETYEVWVSEGKHEFTKITGSSSNTSGKVDFSMEPIFGGAVTVTAPKDSTPLKEFMQDIEKAWTAYLTQSTSAATSQMNMTIMEDNTTKL